MAFFKPFHKTPFWSQFVFGLVAILALPEMQGWVHYENEQETVINQSLDQVVQEAQESEQVLFIHQQLQNPQHIAQQAVVFGKFLPKFYHLEGNVNHPIRAGPDFS